MSGNPFRRPQAPPSLPLEPPPPPSDPAVVDDGEYAVPASPPKTKTGKPKKRVQIISPPQSPLESPDRPRRLSDGQTGSPPPPPVTITAEDARETAASAPADAELKQAYENTQRNSDGSGPLSPPFPESGAMRAPYNPFARTLATSEAAYGLQKAGTLDREEARKNAGGPPKMNVDMFKNILMTGSASPSPPVGRQSQPHTQQPQDGSATDTSSGSRQSLYGPDHDTQTESPRTSLDQPSSSEEEDQTEESSLMGPVASRPEAEGPPPPPKHRHGKALGFKGPQTVSFADFNEDIPAGWQKSAGPRSPSSRSGSPRPSILRPSTPRSASDLNKALPPPPESTPSPQPPAETGAPPEVAATEPISAAAPAPAQPPQAKKPPPPPPTARRQNQGRTRSGSNLTQSSIAEEEGDAEPSATLKPPAPAKPNAPPPPPSRRTQPTFLQPSPSPSVEVPPDEAKMIPPPPPRRSQSRSSTSGITRTPSNSSRSSLQNRLENNAPPAPPPRRTGGGNRNSLDGSRRGSGQQDLRRSSAQSVGSDTSSLRIAEEGARTERAAPAPERQDDVLADLARLQAEVDALRAAAGKA